MYVKYFHSTAAVESLMYSTWLKKKDVVHEYQITQTDVLTT